LVWRQRFIIRDAGPTIFFLLSAASFLASDGFAQMLHFELTEPVAHAPSSGAPAFWRSGMRSSMRHALGGM
jgi:hypothetical protein